MFEYKLYEIKIVNKIPMWTFIVSICAENIVDAEFNSQQFMQEGNEYIIIANK